MRKNRYQNDDDDRKFIRLRYLFFFFVNVVAVCFPPILGAQTNWEKHRAAEKDKSPFVSRIIEYKPAPGQFINEKGVGIPQAAESIVGGVQGLVSLGGYGGYIVVGFDHTIMNDPANPYGVDFTVVGNAAANSSEPGIVMVMADTNGNGLPDDTWYELKGSSYDSISTIHKYTITYTNPTEPGDIPWRDSRGKSGFLKTTPEHTQPYYPSPNLFPDYPQDEVSFTGTLINLGIDEDNPIYIRIPALPFGYADNHPFYGRGQIPYLPDNPATFDELEGNGGNAFDIGWAVDEDGNPVHLDGIDFIKIYTAVNINAGWLGEISTEVCGIIDVSPDDVLSTPDPYHQTGITVYPNPASDYLTIQTDDNISVTRIEIWNISGKLCYVQPVVNNSLLTIPVRDYPAGIYLVHIYEGSRKTVRKVVIRP